MRPAGGGFNTPKPLYAYGVSVGTFPVFLEDGLGLGKSRFCEVGGSGDLFPSHLRELRAEGRARMTSLPEQSGRREQRKCISRLRELHFLCVLRADRDDNDVMRARSSIDTR